MLILFFGIAFMILTLCGLWLLVPLFYGPPSVPTHRHRIRSALQLAKLQPDEVLYDLGAGDGRVLVLAAREFGARAVGIEIGPVQCAVAWLRAASAGVVDRVQVQWKDFYKADLKDADVVFAYLTSREAQRLKTLLERRLKPGARVVTVSFDIPGWKPDGFNRDDLIFVYRMPPTRASLGGYPAKAGISASLLSRGPCDERYP